MVRKLLSTKEKILNAALDLLETSGVKGLTQPAVAKRVGIPQGQLTYHFKKRADLVLAVTESSLDRIAEYLWKKHPDLASRSFDKLIELVLEQMTSKNRMRALLGLIVEADESPEVRAQLIEQGEKVRTLIAAAFRVDEDSAETSVAHATMLGFGLLLFLRDDKESRARLEKHFQSAVGILQAHLKKKGGKS